MALALQRLVGNQIRRCPGTRVLQESRQWQLEKQFYLIAIAIFSVFWQPAFICWHQWNTTSTYILIFIWVREKWLHSMFESVIPFDTETRERDNVCSYTGVNIVVTQSLQGECQKRKLHEIFIDSVGYQKSRNYWVPAWPIKVTSKYEVVWDIWADLNNNTSLLLFLFYDTVPRLQISCPVPSPSSFPTPPNWFPL